MREIWNDVPTEGDMEHGAVERHVRHAFTNEGQVGYP